MKLGLLWSPLKIFCSYVGTRYLVQEHLAFSIWPLRAKWAMMELKDDDSTKQEVGSGSLVRLKYTYKFRNQFEESCDEWLYGIEAKYNEVLGNYVKEDEDLIATFRARGKRRLNHVFMP